MLKRKTDVFTRFITLLLVVVIHSCSGTNSVELSPIIKTVSPTFGPSGGETTITILGQNFSDKIAIKLGEKLCTNIQVQSSIQITCSTPPAEPGVVKVAVKNSDDQISESKFTFDFQLFPIPASNDGVIRSPAAITRDGFGNIYMTDITNHQIQKFNSKGEFLLKFGSPFYPPSIFDPWGIDIDDQGNIYITYFSIYKFDSIGDYYTRYGSRGSGDGQFEYSKDLVIDQNQNFYVADYGNHRVQKLDKDGNFLMKFGTDGSGNGQFNSISGLAVDANGYIYVSDSGNQRIQKFNSNGTYNFQFGTEGSGMGQFNAPQDVCLDIVENIYVADSGNNRIQVFAPDKSFLFSFGKYGTNDGEFIDISSMYIGDNGIIYVADKNRVQEFDLQGKYISKFGISTLSDGQFRSPTDVATDLGGNVIVADTENHRIQKFNSSGQFVTKFGTEGSDNGQFESPSQVAVDLSGNIYVADTGNHRIQKFDSSGKFILKFGTEGSEDGQFASPYGITTDSAENIYVTDTGNSCVQEFDSFGNFLKKFGCTGSNIGQFFFPQGIAVDTDGSVYVADLGNKRIQKFDSIGITSVINSVPIYPRDITLDGLGHLYISSDKIQKFNLGDNSLVPFGNHTSEEYRFVILYGISASLDGSGNVFVADTGNNRIQKIDANGNIIHN